MSIPGKLSSWGCCLWLFSEGVGHLRTLSPLVTVLWDLQEKAPLATVARPWRGVAGSSSRNQSSRRVSELPSRRYWSAGASKKTLNFKKKKKNCTPKGARWRENVMVARASQHPREHPAGPRYVSDQKPVPQAEAVCTGRRASPTPSPGSPPSVFHG